QGRTHLRGKNDKDGETEIKQRVSHHELQGLKPQYDRDLIKQSDAEQSNSHLNGASAAHKFQQSVDDRPHNDEVNQIGQPQLLNKSQQLCRMAHLNITVARAGEPVLAFSIDNYGIST